jgi:hypothetical protein
MKKIALITLLSLFAFQVKAQETTFDPKFRLGVGLNLGAPIENPYNFNLGGDVRLQYDLTRKYSLTLTTGFNNLFAKDDIKDLGYIPVKAGFKAFVLKNKLYLMGEAGAAFAVTNKYNDKSLLLSPTLGYATKYVDISIRYENLNNFPVLSNGLPDKGLNQFMLRLAYGFEL